MHALWKHGASRKGILRYLVSKSDIPPTQKDVDNLLARLKAKEYAKYPTPEARVQAFLKDFSRCHGNIGRVFTDMKDGCETVNSITLQTDMWRRTATPVTMQATAPAIPAVVKTNWTRVTCDTSTTLILAIGAVLAPS